VWSDETTQQMQRSENPRENLTFDFSILHIFDFSVFRLKYKNEYMNTSKYSKYGNLIRRDGYILRFATSKRGNKTSQDTFTFNPALTAA
jgi:hypothetical protein